MTVSSTTAKNTYSGDAATLVFAYTFRILDEDEIVVQLEDSSGNITTQTKTTHYTVSGVGDAAGGNITFVSAPSATETVILKRGMALTQTTDYSENDAFPAETHEEALDRLTMIAQELDEEIDRAVRLPITTTITDATATGIAATYVLRVNSAADGLEFVSPTTAALATSVTPTDGTFLVGDGSDFVGESGATARTSLGLGSIATQAASSVSITGGSVTGITDITVADGGTGASTAAGARTNLGVVIGTDVQAEDAGLTSIAGLTTAANKMIYTTASDTYATTDLTAFARTILDDANEAAFKATVNLEIGTDVQAWDTHLDDIAALTPASSLIIGDGLGSWTVVTPANFITDNSITTSSNTQTLTNKTLTSPTINGANASGGTVTLGNVDGTIDMGGATSLEIPNGTTVTTNAAGEIAMDTNGNGTTVTTGVIQGYDGTQALYWFGATNYPSSDNDVMVYDSATNAVKWEAQTGGGGGISAVVDDTTPQLGGQLDVNGNAIGDGTRELLTFTEDASAVNHVNIENEATGSGPIISSAGDDAAVDLNIDTKSTGTLDLKTGGTSRADFTASGMRLGAANARVTTILDEDTMSSDSDTALATQQSIKAYVDAAAGGLSAASQAQMEAATDNTVAATPDNTQYHPGVAKAWVSYKDLSSTGVLESHNVTSVTDHGAGDFSVNFTTNFSSSDYCVQATMTPGNGRWLTLKTSSFNDTTGTPTYSTKSTSACRLQTMGTGGFSGADTLGKFVVFYGDQ